ncbi:molybdate ABC transporter substrate-binding protein [Phaeobacter sp. B1627]|uniref:molybdate ABC transporter substrate-binding protein n=1 Tax=Phaeobacter sp. B1627 TaxID=2583809 RepID=UPI001118D543|nr:molybdate ABC transporter substrate-binding protein [Phaeobacter sp. B1627]TNJ45940.1 molybdate ABC transporter substrate-binding protein [Phaeobacter sp. B1627]
MTVKNPYLYIQLLLLVLGAISVGPQPTLADTLRIFAAASVKTALDETIEDFERGTGHTVLASYGGSSALARQISLGAPADIFLSANEAWMDYLDEKDLLVDGSREDLFRNQLVIVSAQGEEGLQTLSELPAALGQRRLAMAQTDAVPAGIYGKSALQSSGIWQALVPFVAETDNVRAALALVASGATPYGIVYATDATAEPRVTIALHIDDRIHPPIVYPVAALRSSDAGDAFLKFLHSPLAQQRFVGQGFLPLKSS